MSDELEKRNELIYKAYLDDLKENSRVSWERISDILGMQLSTRRLREIAREMYREHDGDYIPDEDEETTFEVGVKEAVAKSTDPSIKTPEDLVAECNIDLTIWELKDFQISSWGVAKKNVKKDIIWEDGVMTGSVVDDGTWVDRQNYRVRAVFVPRKIKPIEASLDDLMDRLEQQSPRCNHLPISFSKDIGETKHLFVPNIFDAHLNKRAENMTLLQAGEEYKKVVDRLAQLAFTDNFGVKKVLYIVGQDMLNADNLKDTTTWGTWVESSEDLRNAVDVACDITTYAIERFAQIAPVTVMAIDGNHDRYGVYWLGKFLGARFHNHDYVKVINTNHPRKYLRFGVNLIGIDHGENIKPQNLALTMANEAPSLWASTTYREWLRGHFHKKTDMYYPMVNEMGVSIRVMPALCPLDAWHILKGFIGNHRAAEGLFYHEDYGPAGTFPVFVDELK
jgi:hypothetical protein